MWFNSFQYSGNGKISDLLMYCPSHLPQAQLFNWFFFFPLYPSLLSFNVCSGGGEEHPCAQPPILSQKSEPGFLLVRFWIFMITLQYRDYCPFHRWGKLRLKEVRDLIPSSSRTSWWRSFTAMREGELEGKKGRRDKWAEWLCVALRGNTWALRGNTKETDFRSRKIRTLSW